MYEIFGKLYDEMQQAIIGSRYQVVIPKKVRRVAKSLTPGVKAQVEPLDEWSVRISVRPKVAEWLKATRGIGKGLWGKNSTKYLSNLRDEWEDRLKKLGS